ncbi:hypothetical protein CMU35_08885 [Elizabethkingia anophelis]|nr:hypothetical protein [Elizabethkingia anophelis]
MLKNLLRSLFSFPVFPAVACSASLRKSFFQKKNRKKESGQSGRAIAKTKKKIDLMGVPLGGNRSFNFFIGGCVRWLPDITWLPFYRLLYGKWFPTIFFNGDK